jgi:thiamine-phosphate pyrophosphorylase
VEVEVVDPRALEVYVITSSGFVPGRGHLEVGLAAIEGGATAIQLRAPELPDADLLRVAAGLAGRCRDAGVLFVVNDRVDLAVRTGAGGAHVGQEDGPTEARSRLAGGLVLGVSVSSPEEGRAAEVAGADYLGVTVWSTSTKPEAKGLGLDGVREICATSGVPVVGVGGIGARNAREVIRAGAAGVAVVSAVGAAPDPVAATRELAAAVQAAKQEPA